MVREMRRPGVNLVILWEEYRDLGPDHLRRTTPESQAKRLADKIEKLGFTCTYAPPTPDPVAT